MAKATKKRRKTARNSKTPTPKDRQGCPRLSPPKSPEKKIGVGSDLVALFVEHCCVADSRASAAVSDLFDAFRAFVEGDKLPTLLPTQEPTPLPTLTGRHSPSFSRRLGELKDENGAQRFPTQKAGGVRKRDGLKLRPPEPETAPRDVSADEAELARIQAALKSAKAGDPSSLAELDIEDSAMVRKIGRDLAREVAVGGKLVEKFTVKDEERVRISPLLDAFMRFAPIAGIDARAQKTAPIDRAEPAATEESDFDRMERMTLFTETQMQGVN